MARYVASKPHRTNPDLSAGRLESLAVLGVGAGITGVASGPVASLASPVLGMLGAFGKPIATLGTALGLEWLAGMAGAGEKTAQELGSGGIVVSLFQMAAAAGLPVGISTTFPSLGLGAPAADAAPAPGQVGGGNTPSGTGAVPALPAGGRYAPIPGYGSLSAQTGVGL